MFDNVRVSAKILAIIVLSGGICAALAAAAVTSLQTLSRATDEITLTGQEVRLGGRLNRLAVALNRAEYLLAANPAGVEEVAPVIAEYKRDLAEALSDARKTADPKQAELLREIETVMAGYIVKVEDTVALARQYAGAVILGEQQKIVLETVRQNRPQVNAFNNAVNAYADFTEQKGADTSAQASELAEDRINMLIAGAIIGVLLGLSAGWLTSQYGVVKPIRAVVACLRGLADGRLETTVYGVGRKDEVGEIADAAEVFKQNLIRNREMEREAKEAEQRARATGAKRRWSWPTVLNTRWAGW